MAMNTTRNTARRAPLSLLKMKFDRNCPPIAQRIAQRILSRALVGVLTLSTVFVLSTVFFSWAGLTTSPAFSAETTRPLTPSAITDEIYQFDLPSGQDIYIKADNSVPIVTIDTWVETGSVNEGPKTNGISHFLEHLLFKGTPQHPLGEFDHKIEALGGRFNAATSLDYTHYYIQIPSKHFKQALDLHANMLQQAVIPQDALDRERKVVQEEINRALDNPSSRLIRTLNRHLFKNHGYAYDTLGPKSLIASVPRNTILNYYHTWYQPDRFRTVITGDVNPTEAAAEVSQAFSKYQRPPKKGFLGRIIAPKRKATAIAAPLSGVTVDVLEDPNITQAYLVFGFIGPNVNDRQDTYALDTAMDALGTGKTSRLHQQLVEKDQLAQTISAGNWTQKYAGLVYVSAELPVEKRAEARETIFDVINTLKANGITADELKKAQTSALKGHAFLQESTHSLAENIGYNVTIGKLSDHTDYAQALQSVSQDDALTAMNKYIDFNKVVLVEMLPQSIHADLKAEQAHIVAELTHAADAPLSHELANTQTNEASQKIVHPTEKTQLPNGMTILSRQRPSTETVTIQWFIKGGKSTETIPGTASLVASMLKKGTTSRSRETISTELEANGMSISMDVHNDYISVTGSAVKEDVGELTLLMHDLLKNPTFKADELKNVKTRLKRSLIASREKPNALAMENLELALYPWHNYGNTGQRIEQHLDLVTRDVLVDYYTKHFTPNNMVVSIVGHVNTGTVKRNIIEAFPKTMNLRNAEGQRVKHPKAEKVQPVKETKTIRSEKPEQAATWIARGWLAPKLGTDKNYAALKVIDTLLGSGLSSRLFRHLREQQGLAYVTASYFPSTKDQGRFVMYLGTDPKNEAKVLAGFDKEINDLKTNLLTDKELADAKNKLIGNFAMAHETNSNQAFYLGFYETLGQGAHFDGLYPQLINELTAEDIRTAAQQVFSQPHITSIVSPTLVRSDVNINTGEPITEDEASP